MCSEFLWPGSRRNCEGPNRQKQCRKHSVDVLSQAWGGGHTRNPMAAKRARACVLFFSNFEGCYVMANSSDK